MRSIILCEGVSFAATDEIYTNTIQEKLVAMVGLDRTIYKKADVLANPENFSETEFIFSTWGMTHFTHEEIAPHLDACKTKKLIFHHYQANKPEQIQAPAASGRFPFPILRASDGDTVEV